MKVRHLEAELASAAAAVAQPHLDRLRALGVSPDTVARINLAYPAFGIMEGEIDRHGDFVPGPGVAHIVQPVVERKQIIDLVAWRSSNPQRWGMRTGLGWLLNADTCFATRWDGQQLQLHASPLAWLKADAVGGVILDWDAPDISWLRGFERIRCGDAMLGATLSRALYQRTRLPVIETEEMRRAA